MTKLIPLDEESEGRASWRNLDACDLSDCLPWTFQAMHGTGTGSSHWEGFFCHNAHCPLPATEDGSFLRLATGDKVFVISGTGRVR